MPRMDTSSVQERRTGLTGRARQGGPDQDTVPADFVVDIAAIVAAAVTADEAHRSRAATSRYHAGWMSLTKTRRIVRELTVPLQPLTRDAAAPAGAHDILALRELDPDAFKRTTSLTPTQFDELLRGCQPYIEGPRRAGGMETRSSRRGRPVRASPGARLAAALARLRVQGTTPQAPMLPYAGRSTPSADFWHVLGAIEAAYGSVISWPDARRRRKLAAVPCGLEGCIGFVDASEVEIALPTHAPTRSAHHSGKQGTVTISVQLICDHFGNIIDVEGPFAGSNNDIQVWRMSRLGHACATDGGGEYFGEDEFLLGDCGYSGCDRILIPYIDRQMQGSGGLARCRRVFSNVLRRYRAVVEYVFGLIKGRFGMLKGPMTCRRQHFFLAFKVAAILVQLRMRDEPLRERSWYVRDELLLTDWEGVLFADEPMDTTASIPQRLISILDEHDSARIIQEADDERTREHKVQLQVAHEEISGRIASAMLPGHDLGSVQDIQAALRGEGDAAGNEE